jgi:hypothetical protein
MNFLDAYLHSDSSQNTNNQIMISADQACRFAKHVAGDFNPIHDADSKRFCVPGDLLFAIALNRYGLHSSMEFSFLEMLGADVPIIYSDNSGLSADNKLHQDVSTEKGKKILSIEMAGDKDSDTETIENLTESYVRFSGQNFPHILVPLMKEQGVMINPARPLIIYKSMSFELDDVHAKNITLRLDKSSLDVQGKRGNGLFSFSLMSGDKVVGKGQKNLILSGLRPYDEDVMTQVTDEFLVNRDKYLARS